MLTKLRLYLLAIGAVIAAFAASWLAGKSAAKSQVNADRLRAVAKAQEVDNEVEALDTATLKRRAAVWVRGK